MRRCIWTLMQPGISSVDAFQTYLRDHEANVARQYEEQRLKHSLVPPILAHEHEHDDSSIAVAVAPPKESGSSVASFVADTLNENPSLLFSQILSKWSAVLDKASSNAPEALSTLKFSPLEEIQLLNSKMLDCLELPTIKPFVPNASTVGVGEVDENRAAVNTPSGDKDDAASDHSPSGSGMEMGYYSVLHFAAELCGGRDLLVHAKDRCAQGGVPVIVRPDQLSHYHYHHQGSGAAPAGGQYPTFDWVACHGADAEGYRVAHRAAISGNIDVLQYLVELYGAEAVLRTPRLPPLAPSSAAWGGRVYQEGKTAVSCALSSGQVDVLEWVWRHHPTYMQFSSDFLRSTLIGAALNDCVSTFEFLFQHGLLPLPLGPNSGVTPPSLLECLLVHGTELVLRTCECQPALYAAAESGSAGVLNWFIRVFGEEALWVPDEHGATCLHHCARGGNAALLQQLLVDRQAKDCPTAYQYVDTVDGRGRSPAMWCVLGSKKGKRVVDTLKLFLQLGSNWREHRDENQSSLSDLAAQQHSSFSLVRRYVQGEMRRRQQQ